MTNLADKSVNVNSAKPNVGIIVPPNHIHKPQAFDDRQARQKFRELRHDIYDKENNYYKEKGKKAFSGILISTGIVGAVYFIIKNFNRLRIF